MADRQTDRQSIKIILFSVYQILCLGFLEATPAQREVGDLIRESEI